VAGDYYDLFALAPDLVAIAMGDVSGKGLGPALVMAGLHALVRSGLPQRQGDLAGFMGELNQYLLATTPEDVFVTLFLSVLQVGPGRMRYVNGGHPAPLLLAAPGGKAMPLTEGGTVLGIFPEVKYEEGNASLVPGSVLALFSDGVTEARDRHGEMFQEERVIDALRAGGVAPAATVLTGVLAALKRFAGVTAPADDLSLVIIRRQIEFSCGAALA
jgi:sigma-B regulation protein RsbU (phosphoserine phosphatase)